MRAEHRSRNKWISVRCGGNSSPPFTRCCRGALHGEVAARSPAGSWAEGTGPRRGGCSLRRWRPGRGGLRAGGPGARGEQGVERRQRPVQGSARVRQLPGEPGALRGRGLRAAGGQRQEGAPRGPQLAQDHLQGAHLVVEIGRERRQGRAGFGPQGSATAFAGGGPGLRLAVLAASPAPDPRWRSGPGPPAVEPPGSVGGTCAGDRTGGIQVMSAPRGSRSPSPFPVSTPQPYAPHPTTPDCGGLFQDLLATGTRSWMPCSQPFCLQGHLTGVRVFLETLGAWLATQVLPSHPHLCRGPAQTPTSSAVKSRSEGVGLLLSSPVGWGWSCPHLLFSRSVSLVATVRGAIGASPPLVPGDRCGWRGGEE